MFPNSQVIAEESAEETKFEDNVELKFIVDPLDGTTNFTNGWPHAIAIGIVNNNELSGGILYDVIAGTVYSAIKDKGVYACDLVASTAILRELGVEIIGIDGKPLCIETLLALQKKLHLLPVVIQKCLKSYMKFISNPKNK